MMKRKQWRFVLIIGLMVFGLGYSLSAEARTDKSLYKKAIRAVRQGQQEFALLYYRQLYRDYPESKYSDQARFAEAEYLFLNHSIRQSQEEFRLFLKQASDKKLILAAMIDLWRLAESQNQPSEMVYYQEQILDFYKPSLLFQDQYSVILTTPLNRSYNIHYDIEKVSISDAEAIIMEFFYKN